MWDSSREGSCCEMTTSPHKERRGLAANELERFDKEMKTFFNNHKGTFASESANPVVCLNPLGLLCSEPIVTPTSAVRAPMLYIQEHMLRILLFFGDLGPCLVVLYLFLRFPEPHLFLAPKYFYICFLCLCLVAWTLSFFKMGILSNNAARKHIGQSMSYFYPLNVFLNKAHRNLSSRRLIHLESHPHI